MRFYYHIYNTQARGDTTLRVYSTTTDTPGIFHERWSKSGPQGKNWKFAEVDIPAANGTKVSVANFTWYITLHACPKERDSHKELHSKVRFHNDYRPTWGAQLN